MTALRTFTAPLLLTAAFGLSACGDDSSSQGSKAPATPDPVTQDVQEKTKAFEATVQSRQTEVEAITADVKSGKITARKGQAKIEKIMKSLEKDTTDLAAQAADGAKASGDVQQLDLGGDDTSAEKPGK